MSPIQRSWVSVWTRRTTLTAEATPYNWYGDRIWHVHFIGVQCRGHSQGPLQELNYLHAVRQGVFCDLEQSSIDFSALLTELKVAEISGWVVVEQDVLPGTGTPLQSAERNR